MLKHYDTQLSPRDTVRVANEIAWTTARDAPIRALATLITAPVRNDHHKYPGAIWAWIRENVTYMQELPGVEVLGGPYHTLPNVQVGSFTFPGFGVGDCDDLSITFASLCTSINCPAFLAGLSRDNGKHFFHAKGYCQGYFWELSKDEPYGGESDKALVTKALRYDEVAVIYDPLKAKFIELRPISKS